MIEVSQVLAGGIFCAVGFTYAQRLAMRYVAHNRYPGIHKPPLAGDLIAALVGLQIFCFFAILTGRPWMSVILSLALALLLLVVNRVKEQVLHEPLVLADAYLLPQVWKFPEMYFPFMPVKPMLIGGVFLVLSLGIMLFLEPRLTTSCYLILLPWLTSVFLIPIIGVLVLRYSSFGQTLAEKLLRLVPVSHDAAMDAMRNGPLAAAYVHPIQAGYFLQSQPDFLQSSAHRPKQSRWSEQFEAFLTEIHDLPLQERPHVVLIQAESFADIRPQLSQDQQDALEGFLPNWEQLHSQRRILPTPPDAYGAYTMRTEFSMLTGLKMQELGPFAHNPYILAGRSPLWSLARFFSQEGYTSTCLHPYHKDFFQRDKVMPNLGFDAFEDIDTLYNLDTFGPYTSDKALTDYIIERIHTAHKPIFHFAISIEAHGPWQKGRLTGKEIQDCLGLKAQLFSNELQIYLCHLKHMDDMFGKFMKDNDQTATSISDLSENKVKQGFDRPIKLWAYSDHKPSLNL